MCYSYRAKFETLHDWPANKNGSGHLHVKVEVFHQSKVKFNGVELNIIKIQESLKKFSVMYRPYIFEM